MEGVEMIATMTPMEHIRIKPEIYTGDFNGGDSAECGIYKLLKLIIQNSVNQFSQGNGDLIDIYLYDGSAAVSDRGEGIPHENLKDRTEVMIHSGMGSSDSQPLSNGRNAIAIVNALSEEFTVTSYRDNKTSDILYRKGVMVNMSTGDYTGIFSKVKSSGTTVMFAPDPEIFGHIMFDSEIVAGMIRKIEAEYPGLHIRLNDQAPDIQRRYITNALWEYHKDIEEKVRKFSDIIDNIDTLTDEQISCIDCQWFHIDNALDTGVGMFGEGVWRLESEITDKE